MHRTPLRRPPSGPPEGRSGACPRCSRPAEGRARAPAQLAPRARAARRGGGGPGTGPGPQVRGLLFCRNHRVRTNRGFYVYLPSFSPLSPPLKILGEGGFPSWGDQKRIGFSLYRGVKIESANTASKVHRARNGICFFWTSRLRVIPCYLTRSREGAKKTTRFLNLLRQLAKPKSSYSNIQMVNLDFRDCMR